MCIIYMFIVWSSYFLPVSPKALERIEETFKRSSLATGYLPQATFIRDVLGETVPGKLSEVCRQWFLSVIIMTNRL